MMVWYNIIYYILYIIGKINALTYNISFATQINKAIGSEKDFVEACQYKYKTVVNNVTQMQLKILKKLKK